MRAWIRALVLAALLCVAVGACGRGGDIAAPDAGDARMDGAPADSTQASSDTTGRWGGFIGSGG
jgi:predicted small lipoprotein YifL